MIKKKKNRVQVNQIFASRAFFVNFLIVAKKTIFVSLGIFYCLWVWVKMRSGTLEEKGHFELKEGKT